MVKESFNDETMEDLGLKLSKTIEHTFKSSGLNKLIFDGNEIFLFQNEFPHKIGNLSLEESEYILESQISETKYIKLMCPVYLVKGNFIGKEAGDGLIRGVIRPKIFKIGLKPKIFPTITPEFHFYTTSFEGDQIGVSFRLENEVLHAGIMDYNQSERLNVNYLDPYLEIRLDPHLTKFVSFKRC